jgi:hypothetical protein
MTDDMISKAKKKRRSKLQANLIINLNKPVNLQALEQIAAAVARDRADAGEDDSVAKGKKGKRGRFSERINYHVNAGNLSDFATPAHAAAAACEQELEKPDLGKHVPGNAFSPRSANARPLTARDSEPVRAGHAADSPGNAGNVPGSSREIAYRHPDLRQGSTQINPFAEYTPLRGNPGLVGAAALSSAVDMGRMVQTQQPGATHGNVTTQIRDSAGEAGRPAFRATPSGNAGNRAAPHSAPNGASNGSHSTAGNVQSTAVSTKAGSWSEWKQAFTDANRDVLG